MSLLVVADADRPLAGICQLVSHFLAYRWHQDHPDQSIEPLLGIWLDPSPLETVNALSQQPSVQGGPPLVRESFGREGEWYVCWLATDLGPPGETETLDDLLSLLLTDGPSAGALAPCFANTTPEQHITLLLEDLSGRFPGALGRAITQDPETGHLLPHPHLRAPQTG